MCLIANERIRGCRVRAAIGAAQKLLGHASLSTTQRDTDHLELRELKAAVQRRGHAAHLQPDN